MLKNTKNNKLSSQCFREVMEEINRIDVMGYFFSESASHVWDFWNKNQSNSMNDKKVLRDGLQCFRMGVGSQRPG